jgi:hypothetical protein
MASDHLDKGVFMMKLKELEDGDGLEERKKVQKRNHK